MTGLLRPDELTPLDRLMLNAGQLTYPSEVCRAVGLALAACTDEQGNMGAVGSGFLPDSQTLRDVATEIIDVKIPRSTLLHSLDLLVSGTYLICEEFAPGMPYTVQTNTLPLRCMTEDDSADVDFSLGIESDTYGYGEH